MRRLIVLLAILVAVAVGCGGSKTVTVTTSAEPFTPADAYTAAFDQQPARMGVICEAYFSLLDDGLSDQDIYTDLDDAGTFDTFYGQGHTVFKAIVRWCFRHH